MSARDDYPYPSHIPERHAEVVQFNAMLNEIDWLRAEFAVLHTWAGLMSLLDEHYPPDVIDGSSGDPGARIVALTREVDRLRSHAQEQDGAWRDALTDILDNDEAADT